MCGLFGLKIKMCLMGWKACWTKYAGTLRTNAAKHPNENSPPESGGVARRRFISRAGVVPKERAQSWCFRLVNHPVCAQFWESLMRADTPPNLGGVFLFGCF